jgi:hypothetical protein
MAFEVGNKLWELRSKHGRDKIFAEPVIMQAAAIEYFKWAEANPLHEQDFRGKDATEVIINKMRAMTWHELSVFLGVNNRYFQEFRRTVEERDDQISRDFSHVISWIESILYAQKFSGAAAGLLNPNIIARDLGLADKSEIKQNITTQENYVDYTDLSDEALKEIENAAKTKRIEG